MVDHYDDISDPEEQRRAVALVAELEQLETLACPLCKQPVCGHQYVMNSAMGFKDAPRCVSCLAAALGQPALSFLDRVSDYIDGRPCFRAAWVWTSAAEGTEEGYRPACVRVLCDPVADESDKESRTEPASSDSAISAFVASEWNAGDMSCGDLVLELRLRLMKLQGGEVLRLIATDPAAPEDIPAWCNLTGHQLLEAAPPKFLIQRKNT